MLSLDPNSPEQATGALVLLGFACIAAGLTVALAAMSIAAWWHRRRFRRAARRHSVLPGGWPL